jgi:hypothetical protein
LSTSKIRYIQSAFSIAFPWLAEFLPYALLLIRHGAACLILGGRIISLTSVFVNCSLTGATIDLAGPFANLIVGLVALLAVRFTTRASSAVRLFYILAAAFNLLWFSLQLVFSAARRIDDWACAMHQLHVTEPARYGLIAIGALGYLLTVRAIATWMAAFAHPGARARTIVLSAWLTAGAIACATAAFDHNPGITLRHAIPQALVLSIGLLFVPARASKLSGSGPNAAPLGFSFVWVAAAFIMGTASILLLGPGFAIGL